MLLGQWHGLSDAQLEQALKVRIDFMVFTGFEPAAGTFPDASTICRFRNRLVTAKSNQVLLRSISSQLKYRGLKVQGSRGAKSLSPILKKLNTAIGGLRSKVEQAFGPINRKFHLTRAGYFGQAKVHAQMCWAALGMSMLKAYRKLQKLQQPMAQGTGAPA